MRAFPRHAHRSLVKRHHVRLQSGNTRFESLGVCGYHLVWRYISWIATKKNVDCLRKIVEATRSLRHSVENARGEALRCGIYKPSSHGLEMVSIARKTACGTCKTAVRFCTGPQSWFPRKCHLYPPHCNIEVVPLNWRWYFLQDGAPASLVQLVEAPDLESGCCRFESYEEHDTKAVLR